MMFSMPSRFLKQVTISLAERQKTARAKAEGRGGFASVGGGQSGRDADDSWGRSSYSANGGGAKRAGGAYGSASYGAGGTSFGKSAGAFSSPARRDRPTEPEDESQDAPMFAVGEKVRHAKFGSGTIAELTGSGRDLKVRIDFEDEEIGRKTLVLAQAKLERGWE
jgi:DNA helicase-2/ATP-dependent DNA helicase PcrA